MPCSQPFPAPGTTRKASRPSSSLRGLAAVLAAAFLLLAPPAVRAGWELAYVSEEYYPFNYTEKGETRGVSVDLLRLVWKELGEEEHAIRMLPWARAYDRGCNVSNTVLFSMARTPQRENLFRWAGPIATVRFVLIAKKSSRIRLDHLDDLEDGKAYRIGTLRNDITHALLRAHCGQSKVEPLADMRQNILKLVDDRLDMVAYEEASWRKLAMRHGLSPDDYETVLVLREAPVFYAFHRDIPPDAYRDFQRALERVKTSPEYREILDRHLR